MPYVIAICLLSSLMSYGIGFSEILVLKNAVIERQNTYINVPLTMGCFVLAIFFAVIGSLLFYIKSTREQEIIEINDDIEFRVKQGIKINDQGPGEYTGGKSPIISV